MVALSPSLRFIQLYFIEYKIRLWCVVLFNALDRQV